MLKLFCCRHGLAVISIFLCYGQLYADKISFQQIQNQNPQRIGKILYRYWFWNVYGAELYAPSYPFSWHKSFLLKLTYLRDFSAEAIIDETIDQMQSQKTPIDQQKLLRWYKKLESIFPNIKKNQSLIGYFDGKSKTIFFNGKGQYLGQIDSREFSKSFFSIWLSDQSHHPKLSRQLIGLR